MNSPAAICRQLEERDMARGARRAPPVNPLPLMVTPALLRLAEQDAAHAAHELATADPAVGRERYAVLQSKAAEARERVLRLRAALETAA